MGHIKEPKGIDFIVKSRPLTESEELAISEHIRNYKLKNNIASSKTKPAPKKRKAALV
jgi:hypothetical protein